MKGCTDFYDKLTAGQSKSSSFDIDPNLYVESGKFLKILIM